MAPDVLEWTQPFRWGLLTVLDPGSAWVLPDLEVAGPVHATSTCATASVLHATDVEPFEGWPHDLPLPAAQVTVIVARTVAPGGARVDLDRVLECPSGHLQIGDAERARVVEVSSGSVRVQLSLFPPEHADVVVLRLVPGPARI